MFSTHPIATRHRCKVALVVTAFAALAIAAPTALAAASQGGGATSSLERHFQHEDLVLGPRQNGSASSVLERHFRHEDQIVSRTGASTVQATPDWFERYAAAHPYGGGLDVTVSAPADGRSPDTRDAARTPRPVEIVLPGGFDWGDAGIGAVLGAGVIGLIGGSLLLLARLQRRPRTRAT